MECRFDRDIIQKYIDNTIDPLEYIFLKEHIHYCARCRTELKLLSAVDSGLDGYFSESPDTGALDALLEGLVDDCVYEYEKKRKLSFAVKKSLEISRAVVENTWLFTDYLPGNRLLKQSFSRSAKAANGILKSFLKKEARKLLPQNL